VRLHRLKRLFVGTPLPTAQSRHERLGKATALAVFASDALSSVAYATEEILLVLVLAGSAALSYLLPIGLTICVLIAIVISSYRQTIRAYPHGGGAYIVTKDNLGVVPGLVAGAALLIDYVLTVAVSVAAGMAALTSAVPVLFRYRVILCIAAVALIAVANLRGEPNAVAQNTTRVSSPVIVPLDERVAGSTTRSEAPRGIDRSQWACTKYQQQGEIGPWAEEVGRRQWLRL